MYFKGCIDDTVLNDTGNECEDAVVTTGTDVQCLAVVDCILATSCSAAATYNCFCDSGPPSSTCNTGACAAQIASAFGFPVSDGSDIATNFDKKTYAGGMADWIFNCAVNKSCGPCLR
jgi:hypothetical protein